MNNNLKPCPFCGEKGMLLRHSDAGVRCRNCGAWGPTRDKTNTEGWNTRAADARLAALEAENARLRGALDTIINHPPTDHDFTSEECLSMCVDFASEALSGEAAQ